MFIPHNDIHVHVHVLHILIFFIYLQPCWCQFPAWAATCFTISTEGEYRRTIPYGAPSTTMSLLVRCRGLGGMQGGNLISKLTNMSDYYDLYISYIGNFFPSEILAKMSLKRYVKFSLSLIFAISCISKYSQWRRIVG